MMKNIANLLRNRFLLGLAVAGIAGSSLLLSQEENNLNLKYAKYTAQFEGRRNKVYDPNPMDNKPEPTIGVGHYLGRPNSKQTLEKVLPGVSHEKLLSGEQALTDEQIDVLLASDIEEYVKTAQRLFPQFDSYPLYLRQALVDGCYRGDLLDSPKTRELINQGRWEDASREYLNRDDYRNAGLNGMNGITKRMNKNRDAMRTYAKR